MILRHNKKEWIADLEQDVYLYKLTGPGYTGF